MRSWRLASLARASRNRPRVKWHAASWLRATRWSGVIRSAGASTSSASSTRPTCHRIAPERTVGTAVPVVRAVPRVDGRRGLAEGSRVVEARLGAPEEEASDVSALGELGVQLERALAHLPRPLVPRPVRLVLEGEARVRGAQAGP